MKHGIMAVVLLGAISCGEEPASRSNMEPAGSKALPNAPVGEWRWYAAGSCRDASSAGFGYRYGTSNSVMIYFHGEQRLAHRLGGGRARRHPRPRRALTLLLRAALLY